MSAMSVLSYGLGGSGDSCWLSCGVHVAGVNVNWDDSEDSVNWDDSEDSVNWDDSEDSVNSDVNSFDSLEGVPLRVVGMKRCSSSLSLYAVGWRGVNLDQSMSSVN